MVKSNDKNNGYDWININDINRQDLIISRFCTFFQYKKNSTLFDCVYDVESDYAKLYGF